MSISVGKAEKKLVKMVKTDPSVSSSSGSSRAFMIRIVLPFTPHLKIGPSMLCPSVGLRTGPQGDRGANRSRGGRRDHSEEQALSQVCGWESIRPPRHVMQPVSHCTCSKI